LHSNIKYLIELKINSHRHLEVQIILKAK